MASGGDQVRSIPLSGADFGSQAFEGTIECGASAAIIGAQVGVARGKREAVRFAHDRADYDLGVEVQVGSHLLDDATLLGIFTAEVGEAGLHDFEKFKDNGCDALKMSGARTSFEAIAEAFDIHQRAKTLRIDFFRGRCE